MIRNPAVGTVGDLETILKLLRSFFNGPISIS